MPPVRDATGTATRAAARPTRWAAHPIRAAILRTIVFLVPVAVSLGFVYLASHIVPTPTQSLVVYVAWWVALSGSATFLLIGVDRFMRRFLPLVALYRVSLVFPDAAPSRFRTALGRNTTETLEERLARARDGGDGSTPVGAATRLLELVASLDQHDPLTRGHSERVRAYSQLIGKELRLRDDELDLLNWAALIHDVGKLEVPTEILSSPDTPTEEEWKLLRDHPARGEELVRSLEGWLGEWTRAVGEHHERWDGTGYPNGLGHEQIALAARIVAVADVFDVITSARSYKVASDTLTARQEITNCAGTHFDPVVVRAFLGVSLGRLRLVMGPLSSLSHVPALARMPLTPVVGSAVGAAASITAAVGIGLVHPTPAPAEPLEKLTSPLVTWTRETTEDKRLLVRVAGARAGAGAPILLRVLRGPSAGAVTVTRARELAYTPPPDFHGTVVIAYRACWKGGICEDGQVTIVVRAVNDAPIARPDPVESAAGRAVSIDVLANDDDPDGDRLSIAGVRDVSTGTARALGGKIVYTPSRGFAGTARFAYGAGDGSGRTSRARVTVVVSGPDAPPPVLAPARAEPARRVTEPRPTEAPHRDAPLDAKPAAPEPTPEPDPTPHATPEPTPAPRAAEAPSFTSGSDQVVPEDAAEQAVAWANAISTGSAHDVAFDVTTDALGLFAAGASPAIGTDGTLRFRPAPDASGSAVVTVRLRGTGPAGEELATTPRAFTITVTPVNDAPVATADTATTAEDDVGGVTFDVLANDSDVDQGDSLSVESVDTSTLAGGALTANGGGSFTYVPESGFTGADTFTYVVDDGHGGSASAAVTVTVTPVPHPPVAANDAFTVLVDDALDVVAPGLLANDADPDSDALTVDTTPVSGPAHGDVVLLADGSFTYKPLPAFAGPDEFTYRVVDATGRSATGQVTITVETTIGLTSNLYFQSSGPTPDVWSLSTSLAGPVSALADLDGDLQPGVTIRNSDGKASIADDTKSQTWTFVTPAPFALNGPVRLDLWSAAGSFTQVKKGFLYAYLYDCTPGGASCTMIASNTILENPWNTAAGIWGNRLLTVGSVSRTIAAGNELRIRLLYHEANLWVMMSQTYPSALVVTLG